MGRRRTFDRFVVINALLVAALVAVGGYVAVLEIESRSADAEVQPDHELAFRRLHPPLFVVEQLDEAAEDKAAPGARAEPSPRDREDSKASGAGIGTGAAAEVASAANPDGVGAVQPAIVAPEAAAAENAALGSCSQEGAGPVAVQQEQHTGLSEPATMGSILRLASFLPAERVVRHEVTLGDTLTKLARTRGVSVELLMLANGLRSDVIRFGQVVLIPRGPYRALIEKDRFRLSIFCGDLLVVRYGVGLGRDDRTPVGLFRVLSRVKNPEWTSPEGVYFASGDPGNPIGCHWVGIGGGYGIHGTSEPDSIGRAVSNGCIRLRNEHAAEVHALLTRGSSVEIR
ncbi:L,D-transpeptidase family protein [Planctomycetota bacterium]